MESSPYQLSSFRMISTVNSNPLQPTTTAPMNFGSRKLFSSSTRMRPPMAEATTSLTYRKFVQFALEETRKHTRLSPSTLQEKMGCLSPMDGKTEIEGQSFDSPKIRLLRSLYIEGSDGMQVLDLAIFPRAEFDLPIFCANFFSTAATNIVVLDLNPLHDVITQQNYKKKYYTHLIPLGLEYGELLPWGGKITAESMKFFSPIVIWSKFLPSEHNHHLLYSAFKDYLKSWLELMDHASGETDVSRIMVNLEAQHKYLTWRAEKESILLAYEGIPCWQPEKLVEMHVEKFKIKGAQWDGMEDPGHQLLRRLVGETRAKEVIKSFLFYGVDELGDRTFIDYFPEYKCDDGTVNKKRSMIGKSFESRPWDSRGEYIGDDLR